MSNPTIAEYLKFANLQMAAEAFLALPNGTLVENLRQALIDGNKHASRFTPQLADDFLQQWDVVAQLPNTTTGFSGTLFKHKTSGELILSFRSTEFVDDAIRDSAATNSKEVFDTGWAWGQISDMEAWYQTLVVDGVPLSQRSFSVTGYSLGGHLATAFNLLHNGDTLAGGGKVVKEVVTFNGAGVGKVNGGETLESVLNYFNGLRTNPDTLKAALNLSAGLLPLYEQIRTKLADGTWTATQARHALNAEYAPQGTDVDLNPPALPADAARIRSALDVIIDLQAEANRIKKFSSGGSPDVPLKVVPAAQIEAETLDYRLAVLLASQRTSRELSVFSKTPGDPPLANSNQWDLVGKETVGTAWSAVANSGVHYGTNVDLFIEGQPLTRGSFVGTLIEGLTGFELNLLQNKYDLNNFADTHSLVLIVDSLKVQDTLLNLIPAAQRPAATDTFLGWEYASNAIGRNDSITPTNRGYIAIPGRPGGLPGYRWVDVIDAKDGKRYRYTESEKIVGRKDVTSFNVQAALKRNPNYDLNVYRWTLDKSPAPEPPPRYGVTFEDHVIPEERYLGIASSTIQVIDLETKEVLGEVTRYAWSPAAPSYVNPSPWLTAYRCPDHAVGTSAATRKFVDQILIPAKEK